MSDTLSPVVKPHTWPGTLRLAGAVVVLAALVVWTGVKATGPRRCDRLGTMVALEMAGHAGPAAHLRTEWQEMSGRRPEAFARALRHALLWDYAFTVFCTLA